jgi:MFS family permease
MVSPAVLQFGGLTDPTLLLTALAGGAFGAALGALPAFIFTGFMVIAGEVISASGIEGAGEGVSLTATGFTGTLGFGTVFGPHVAFAAGAAAAAYAAKQGYIDDGKNILWAAGTQHLDVLGVGAIFGLLGHALVTILVGISWPTDPIATTVFVSALIHRVAFGYSVIGEITGSGMFDVSPWERDEDEAPGIWLPWQYKWSGVTAIGLIGGLLGGYTYTATGSVFISFGISAASLVFLQCGVDNIPVTHHITFPGAFGAMGAAAGIGSASPTLVLIFGGLWGIGGALLGEICNRVFYMHGSTHVDPPAFAIAIMGILAAVMTAIGVFDANIWFTFEAFLG